MVYSSVNLLSAELQDQILISASEITVLPRREAGGKVHRTLVGEQERKTQRCLRVVFKELQRPEPS